MANNCVKYLDPTSQLGVVAWTQILDIMHCDLDLEDINWNQGHDTPLGNNIQ